MTDITEFIRARLYEWEVAALRADQEIGIMGASWYGIAHTQLARSGYDAAADHMEHHDPARVLTQVAAMRAIVDAAQEYSPELEHGDNGEWAFDATLRHLAAIWSSHPDYDPAWAPEGE